MNRVKYIGSAFLRMLSLLIGVSIISFILVTNSPIDPLTSYVGVESTLSIEAREEIAEHWGFDDPAGKEWSEFQRVRDEIGERIKIFATSNH